MSGTTQTNGDPGLIREDPWGARARDWAEIEDENSRPLFERVFDEVRVGAGTRTLDVGCGSGLACAIAAGRGAEVHGLDSSPALLALARERLGGGDFRAGDMVALPFEDDTVDLVTFFNTFFFAADREAALREAKRVARPGGLVVVTTWTAPERIELTAYLAAVGPLLPAESPKLDPFIAVAELERLARNAGLEPQRTLAADWSWEYPDLETALRGLLSPGISALAIEHSGEAAVRDAIAEAVEPLRLSNGRYRIENTVECVVTRA